VLACGAPLLRAADAEPGERCPDIGRDVPPDHDPDRLLGVGRGEDLFDLTVVADSALIERQLDTVVSGRLAFREGGGEVRVVAAPAMERGGGDLEEIGDLDVGQAMRAELAGLIGIGWPIRVGGRRRRRVR